MSPKLNSPRAISLFSGSILIVVWTIIRSFTNGVNFDIVGQIGVVDQWSQGMHDGVQFGATNYLLKLPLYYLVQLIGGLSPHAKLLVLAVVCNLATYMLIFALSEKILTLYKLRPNQWFYLSMVWLAAISDHVFWLDYANSRNLETVGGLLALYVGLKLLRQPSRQQGAKFLVAASLVFFADPLQVYVIGGGLVLYTLIQLTRKRSKPMLQQAARIVSVVAGAFIGAKFLLWLATHILPVSFLTAPTGDTSSLFSVASLRHTFSGMLISTLRIFDAAFFNTSSIPNVGRELLNAIILLSIVAVVAYVWRSRKVPRQLLAIITCSIITTYLAYVASGQALQPMTERYLIMIPMLSLLAFSACAASQRLGYTKQLQSGWLLMLALSTVLIFGALVVSWPQRYSKDTRFTSMLTYLQQSHNSYAASSRDGIVVSYFGQQQVVVAPLICQPDHRLVVSNLFFDSAGIKRVRQANTPIPLILPAGGIVSSGYTCTASDVEKQFGSPLRQESVTGVGTALFYPAKQLL